MKLGLSSFQGIAPRIAEHLLPAGSAVIADNCRLLGGSLKPWYGNGDLYTPSPQSTWPPYRSIFRYQSSAQRDAGTAHWCTWLTDVQASVTPIPNDEHDRLYFTGDGAPKVTSSDIIASGSGAYPQTSYYIGVPAPSTAPTLAKSGTPSSSDPTTEITRSCVYTFVNEYGEESAPSPVSSSITCNVGEQWDITGLEITYSANYRPIDSIRVYLSNTGSTGTEFQLVETLDPPATSATSVPYAFTAFEEVLATEGWYTPPSDMIGIIGLPWGSLAGFAPNDPLGGSGNAVYLTPAYQVHAWLTDYAFAVAEQIVGLASFGNALLVLTDGLPTVAIGTDPSSLSIERIENGYACTSRRGIVNISGNVYYPCSQGLASVGIGGSKLVTERLLTEREWATYYPYTINAYAYNGNYIAFFDSSYDADSGYTNPRDTSATRGGFIFNPANGTLTTLTGIEATAGFAYLGEDKLALHVYSDSDIVLFDNDSANPLTYIWQSRPGLTPFLVGMAAMRVYAAAYPVLVDIYIDDVIGYRVYATSETPIRLPASLVGRRWQAYLTGTVEVFQVELATSMEELMESNGNT